MIFIKGNQGVKLAVCFGVLLLMLVVGYKTAKAGSIVGSKHDLSTLGVSQTSEPCVFCHTPHGANTIAPLWNRHTPTSAFTMYESTTMDTSHPGQPNSISLACLGCHDGVLSDIGDVINEPGSGFGDGVGCIGCHSVPVDYGEAFPSYLGTNLSNDHPISIAYPTAVQDSQFVNQPVLSGGRWFINAGSISLPLFNSKNIECATCHNVHDPDVIPFLRASNAGSALCNACHTK